MNWKIHGVKYAPFQRAYDRRTEGDSAWRARMRHAREARGLTCCNNMMLPTRFFNDPPAAPSAA